MHILIFYTFNQGLLSQFYKELAIRLSRDGHQVTFFSLKRQNMIDFSHPFELIIKKRGGYLKTYYDIFRVLMEQRPDVVLSNFSYVNPALLFGRLLGVSKNIAWFHSLNEQTGATYKQIFIKKQFLGLADLLIANSERTKEELIQVYNLLDSKVKAIPFWTPIDRVLIGGRLQKEKSSDVFRIGCPGRLEPHKNQQLVIRVLYELNAAGHQSIQLFLAGQGEDNPNLKALVKKLKLDSKVVFLGHLSHVEMLDFYQSMDVIVLPSLHEAFGLVFIEALALGCPVLVSSSFGALGYIHEEVEEMEVFVFDPENIDSLTQRLLLYIEGHGLERDYFKDLYERYFNPETIYQQIKEMLLSP